MNALSTSWTRIYIGLGLTTMATLLLELGLTRLFSVVFYYHFAFLAISIALFGLGAGGVFSYVVAGWKQSFFAKLGALAAVTAGLVLLALVFVLTRRGEPGYGALALIYFTTALPFFTSGTIVSLVIAETIDRVNRVYFADLLGAAAGCLLLIPMLDVLGGPATVIAVAALFAATGAVWFALAGSRRFRNAGIALAAALTLLVLVNTQVRLIDVRYAKGRTLANERLVKWNSFSRIGVTGERGSAMIFIDADASTGIPAFDLAHLSEQDRHQLLYQGPGLPYAFHPGSKTLIIGSGGGWDVARALASGSRDVTAVEINPIIANTVMRERFPQFSRGLYFRPDVRLVVEDGRSFVRRSAERYQIIQATLVDTWASTAAGAFALSENNLYTTDAFRDYLSHLTDDGILVFTRWGLVPPRESLRLVTLACDALGKLGNRECWRHVLVVREGSEQDLARWGAQDTVLISRKALTDIEIERFRTVIAGGRFQPVYLPGARIPNAFTELLTSSDPRKFQQNYAYDISPVDDNRPFFFYTVQLSDIREFLSRASRLSADYNINRAVPLLFGLFLVSLAATGIMLALPRVVLGRRLPRDKGVFGFLWYFMLIGAGYILIQVALVQKFVLFLGRPTYALTVIVFSMLLSSGVGSFFSERAVAGSDARLRTVLAGVAGMVALLAFALSPLLGAGVGLPLVLKFAISAAVIAPVGLLMGIPFPAGLRRLEARHRPSVGWAWSLNAAASVLGSVSSIVLAIYLGLRETVLVGGGLYICALATVWLTRLKENACREPEVAQTVR